jgi:hypothetical protein
MKRASDVNNVADRTETPSSRQSSDDTIHKVEGWSERRQQRSGPDGDPVIMQELERGSDVQRRSRPDGDPRQAKLKVNNLRVLYNGPSRVQVGYK